MSKKRPIERLRHDRRVLLFALEEYESTGVPNVSDEEQALVIDTVKKRIADIDAMIEVATTGQGGPPSP